MRGVKKQHLPSKTCPACLRPFTWRKKWERDWEAVQFCSDRCRRHHPAAAAPPALGAAVKAHPVTGRGRDCSRPRSAPN